MPSNTSICWNITLAIICLFGLWTERWVNNLLVQIKGCLPGAPESRVSAVKSLPSAMVTFEIRNFVMRTSSLSNDVTIWTQSLTIHITTHAQIYARWWLNAIVQREWVSLRAILIRDRVCMIKSIKWRNIIPGSSLYKTMFLRTHLNIDLVGWKYITVMRPRVNTSNNLRYLAQMTAIFERAVW